MTVTLRSATARQLPRSPFLLVSLLLMGTALAVYTVLLNEHVLPRTPLLVTLQLINIVSFLLAGVLAWWRHPDSRTGMLMVLAGFAFLINQLQTFPSTRAIYLGNWLGGLPHLLLAHLILTYPTGRFTSAFDRAVIVVAYVLVVGLGFLFNHPVYVVHMLWVGVGITFIAVGLGARRWLGAEGARRRVLRPVPFAALVFAGGGTTNAVAAFSLGTGTDVQNLYTFLLHVQAVLTPLVPLVFLLGFQQTRRLRGTLGDLVVQLENVPEPGHLQEAVARALRDPTLELGYWVPQRDTYLDATGRAVLVPDDPERLSTTIEHEGEKLAIIVHDVALREERALVDAVLAAAKLALVNERLQAEVRAQLEEVQQSRSRIVAAGDAERKKIERDLHDGAQQRLVSLNLALKLLEKKARDEVGEELASEVTRVSRELRGAIDELRELTQGLHPTILSERGLGPALESLAERAPIPVSVSTTDKRFHIRVETAAYFTVSEALTNIAKHAEASRAEVTVREENRRLLVRVADDGRGGADPRRGSGLVGLDDRVAAIGGSLKVDSVRGKGTTITVALPCA